MAVVKLRGSCSTSWLDSAPVVVRVSMDKYESLTCDSEDSIILMD